MYPVESHGLYSLEGPDVDVSSRNWPLHLQSATVVEGAEELADIRLVHRSCDVVAVCSYEVMVGLDLLLKIPFDPHLI